MSKRLPHLHKGIQQHERKEKKDQSQIKTKFHVIPWKMKR